MLTASIACHGRARPHKSDLSDLWHFIVQTSGKPEVRCHPRLSYAKQDVDARVKPAHDTLHEME
jgi:hypothetical protein